MTTNIIISRDASIDAKGKHIHTNSKPVFCVSTGQVWPSVTDAAESIGVNIKYLSNAIHKGSKCHGHVYKFMSESEASIPAMLARIQALSEVEAKAKAYDEMMAEQEKERKAEEKRKAEIAKAEAKVKRCREIWERKQTEANKARDRLNDAKIELDVLMDNFK